MAAGGAAPKAHKTLVTYFSASGVTKAVAKDLAEVTGADLFEIRPAQPYTAADLDWTNDKSRSSVECHDPKSRPAIAEKVENFDQYDVIYVGFPIWWYTAPNIINTFLESHNIAGKTLIPFATSGGSSISRSQKDLEKWYPKATWKKGRLLNSATRQELRKWVNSL